VVLSKAIGGSLPLAVVVYREELDTWKPGAHTGTFRGNQLAMAAGLATLRYILEHDLAAHAENMGRLLMQRLHDLQAVYSWIGDVRGRGLMIGAELVDPERQDRWGRYLHDGVRARALQHACFQRGLILEVGGRHGSVLRFLPPLIVTEEEVYRIADIVTDACAAVARQTEVQHV
jgi:diaminobutyrate-2-oxoglutarate transaminase